MSLTVNGNGDTAYTTGDTITTSANTGTNIFGNDNTADLATGQVVGVYGGGNTVSAQSGNHVYVVGTDTNFDNITVSNDNTGTTAFDGEAGGIFLDNNVQVSLSGSNDTLGLGGTGDSLGVFGDSNTIDAGAGNWIVVGSPWSAVDTLNVTGDQGSGTTANGQPVGIAVNPDAGANVSGGDDAVYLQTGSSYVGLLGGSGYTVVTYTGGTVATWADTSFNMYGIDTNIYSGGGDNFGAFGGGNVITAQEGDSVTIDETAGNIDSVYVTNDQAGIFINSGGSANVTWGGDTIVLNGEGSYAGLIGYAGYTVWASSGGSMATTADTGFTVNGSNTSIDDTAGGDYFGVSGGGNNIQAQSGDHIFLSGTDGNFDAVTAAGDNASTTSADGEQGGIWLYSNTQLQLIGSYNLTNLGSGDNLDASGGGNAINAQANDFVYISGTGGNLDSVSASGLQDNGTSADGDTSGIYLAAGAEANVSGGNDAIFPDSGSYVGLLGGTGYSVSGAGFSLDTSPDTGFDVFRQRRQISASARRQSCRSKTKA